MARQLEIGPGQSRLGDEWVTADCIARGDLVDVICCWGSEPLPFAENSFDLVYASHVLEHVPWHLTLSALREARRVLVPGGRIELHVPDFDVLIHAAQQQRCLDRHAEDGLNTDLHWMHWVAERLFHCGPEHQWHRACFNRPHLLWCLDKAGYCGSADVKERGRNHGVINLGLGAVKPRPGHRRASSSGGASSRDQALFPCGAREPLAGAGPDRFRCLHPRVSRHRQEVSASVCRTCTYVQHS